MTLFRSTIYFFVMLTITVFFSILIIASAPFKSQNWLGALGHGWSKTNNWWLYLLCRLKYKLYQAENIPEKGKTFIYMINHQSAWETLALREILPSRQAWVLKKELTYIPIFGWALMVYDSIAIDRNAGKKALKQLLEQGTRSLTEHGNSIIIFPEGTRTAVGEDKKYAIGGAMLASKTGVPIIPIAHNAGAFWERKAILKYPGTIDMIIGEEITTKGKKASEINKEVKEAIDAMKARLPISKVE